MFKVTKDKIVLITWIDFTDGFINALLEIRNVFRSQGSYINIFMYWKFNRD